MTTYNFANITIPNTPVILPNGINDSGEVVGFYEDAAGAQHGFVYENGTATTLDIAGATGTRLIDVNASGQIIGEDYTAATGSQPARNDAFIDTHGSFQTVAVPGGTSIDVTAINDYGEVVGSYDDSSNQRHAFIDVGGTITTVTPNNAQLTVLADLNNSGTYVGTFEDTAGKEHAFTGSGRDTTQIDVAGATETIGSRINASGEIAGLYYAGGGSLGFTESNGKYTTFGVPGQQYLIVQGIDDAGEVTGYYVDGAGLAHGFTEQGGSVTVVDDPQSAETAFYAINNVGQLAGYAGGNHDYVGIVASPAAPTITGATGGQQTTNEKPVSPFGSVKVSDPNDGTNTLTITLSGGGGALADGAGFSGAKTLTRTSDTSYTLTGTAQAVTAELDALSFTPAAPPSGGQATTTLTLSDTSSASPGVTVSNAQTTVTDTDPTGTGPGTGPGTTPAAVAPTITGTVAGQATKAEAPVTPFSGVSVGDANAGASDTLTIVLSGGGGILSDAAGAHGLTANGDGSYTLSGTTASITAELDRLSFTPAAAAAGSSAATTRFTLNDASSAGTSASNSGTTVTDTPAPAAPPPAPVDVISVDPAVTYLGGGRFIISGQASSTAGVKSVKLSAIVDDGSRQDLGAATLDGDGRFTYTDTVGATQSFILTTLTDGATGTVTVASGFDLTAGITGEPYVARQDSYDPASAAFSGQTFFNADGSVYLTDSYTDNGDGTADYTYSGGTFFDGKTFLSFTDHYADDGRLLIESRSRNDGGTSVIARSPGQSLQSSAGDVLIGGGAANTQFVFTPGFGTETVRAFTVAGAGHGTIDLAASDFADVADVLRNTRNAPAGAVIADPTSGDIIKLIGVTKADLLHHRADIQLNG